MRLFNFLNKGQWITISPKEVVCSECNHAALTDEHCFVVYTPYCPFCGVKMRGDKK